jgi:hypothetical protein
MQLWSVSLLSMALAVTSVTASTAQLTRTEKIPVGTVTDFYDKGAIEVTAEIPHSAGPAEKALTIRVTASLNGSESGIAKLSVKEVATAVANLQEMAEESAKSPDYLEYLLAEKKFVVSIEGGSKAQFGVSADGATAGTYGLTEVETRQVLKDFVDLLKKGQAVLESK